MREISLDTETTGLKPEEGHKVIEIGCVELINKRRTGNNLHIYINPERSSSKEALKIHGLTDEFLSDKPVFTNIAAQFREFIADDTLVIHNAGFDLKFLNHELSLLGMPAISNNIIDTLLLARKMFPGSPANLDALCKRFGVDATARIKHGALLDAELLAEIYIELCGGSQSSFEFGNKTQKTDNQIKEKKIIVFPKRDFSPNAEELKAHQDFIKEELKDDSLWADYN